MARHHALSAMVTALVDAAYDKKPEVRNIISSSLVDIGKQQPTMVLSCCHVYLKKHSKLQREHRVVILQTIEKVIEETLDAIKAGLASELVQLAAEEMTATKEVEPQWQTAASGVLVALGKKYCNEVMEEVLKRFQPGALPHFFIVQTMANLATANPFSFVPFLTAVLGTMLPMLGLAKHDNMRWVFSCALARFSESILHYVANIENAPDQTVRKELYSSQIYSAYNIVYNVWLQSKEPKLRLMIVEALGYMSNILAEDILEEQLPRLLPGILNLYKKHPEPYHITQGFCMVLDAAVQGGNLMLEPQVDSIVNTLHPQVCIQPDYNSPPSVKNHNELLRCFSVIAKSFSNQIIGFLLQKLETNNEKIRMGTLAVFKQLINSGGTHMEDKKTLIVSGLKIMLAENNNKVKRLFAQVVIAMAPHGYLELEGGHLMVEFIVKLCVYQEPIPLKKPDPEHVSNASLRLMCENVLHLISTTIECMESVLWPYLLEFLIPPQYTTALGPICRNLASLAAKKREEQSFDYMIDFEERTNIPRPAEIIARLMVLSGRPEESNNRGINTLKLMQALSPNIEASIVDLWDTIIPKLVQYLEDNLDDPDKWSQKAWEDLLLKLLSKTLDEVEDEEWVCNLGVEFGKQVSLYTDSPREKNFLYKCLGVIMRKVTKKDFVKKHLNILFTTVKHTNQVEREGCAIGLGFCASSHLDEALSKLESVAKEDMSRKSSGFLGLIKDKSEADVERIKSTIMLCYGYLTLYAPHDLITSRLDTNILRNIQPHFNNIKDTTVKQNLILAVDLIGKAVQPGHLRASYSFSRKMELMNHMQMFMKKESTKELTTNTRALAMDACATLVKLDPLLTEAETFELIKTSTDCVFKLPNCVYPIKGKDELTTEQIKDSDDFLDGAQGSLVNMLKEILSKKLTPQGIQEIYKHLQPWNVSVENHERQRSMRTTLHLLQFYHEKMAETQDMGGIQFNNLGLLLGSIVPRCSDPCLPVREDAIDCIQVILRISLRYDGQAIDYQDPIIEAMTTLRDRVSRGDAQVLFSVVNDMSKALSKKLPSHQLNDFLANLYNGLLDSQSHCSSGACVVINTIMKTRGPELLVEVGNIITALHTSLRAITYSQTRSGVFRAIRTLASNHLSPVFEKLLNFPLPYDEHITECWRTLAVDPVLAQAIFDEVIDILNRQIHYEEKRDQKTQKVLMKVASLLPLSAVCALTEVFCVPESEVKVVENFHRLFSALIIYTGSCIDVKPAKLSDIADGKVSKERKAQMKLLAMLNPSSVAIESVRKLLERANCRKVLEAIGEEEMVNSLRSVDTLPEGITEIARQLVEHNPEFVGKIMSCLNPSLASLYENQRIVVVAYFAELINQKCAGDMSMVEMIVNNLLGRLVDANHIVRMLCIRGLGNIASTGEDQVQKYCTTVLSAMMAGMDDKEDPEDNITLESMSGLSRILTQIEESSIRPILVNITLRIRPCFEKERASVRAAAFQLFGSLSHFGDGPSKAPFLEQIHTNFVSVLLHLNDEDLEVRKSCKHALRQFGPLLGSESINEMFQKHLIVDGHLNYGEFMYDLTKVIIADFIQKINFFVMGNVSFFRSSWPEIRSNAAIFVGFLLGNLPKAQHSLITKDHVCGALTLLLKDPVPSVRIKAAEAMSLLFEY
ncbi:maestro heat-like repeat-containing protein family member 1 isoform X2 [Anneissia japonica]|uniref:maestro heat-like repeat-containing protein family member 1 isoform X2 n=1 Tax=Anneissia japonica TaxID=1529436 RepID=UPI0014257798|nr:maestro heat-like repeat-containing protein family member 1 isoform X2 [Anneissia japonica]